MRCEAVEEPCDPAAGEEEVEGETFGGPKPGEADEEEEEVEGEKSGGPKPGEADDEEEEVEGEMSGEQEPGEADEKEKVEGETSGEQEPGEADEEEEEVEGEKSGEQEPGEADEEDEVNLLLTEPLPSSDDKMKQARLCHICKDHTCPEWPDQEPIDWLECGGCKEWFHVHCLKCTATSSMLFMKQPKWFCGQHNRITNGDCGVTGGRSGR
jgi:hypothetical protein